MPSRTARGLRSPMTWMLDARRRSAS
jgi:hypothetical protein